MESRSYIRTRTALLRIPIVLTIAAMVAFAASPAAPAVGAQAPGENLAMCAEGVRFIGFSDALNKTEFGGFAVKELSGIAYDEHNGLYYSLADRDKATPTHFFTLDIPVGSDALAAPTIRAVTELTTGGAAYNGYGFDGEGIALSHNKQLFAASEGGQQPEIRRFSLDGAEAESLAVPDRFLVGTNNISFESLALSPSGRSLFTANERSLPAVGESPADGRTEDLRNRIRILRYEDRGPDGFAPAEQYFYLTEPDRVADPDDVGVVDLIALSETDLLVMERGFYAPEGNTVRIFRVSLEGAADVSGEPSLAAEHLAPVAKTLLVDLANCPAEGAVLPPGAVQPTNLMDNFEDMALGAYLPGGYRALVLQSDDNGGANQTTRLVALSIPVAPF